VIVNVEKAFQSFFNDWVEKETARRFAELTEGARFNGYNTVRHEVRDEALVQIRARINRVLDDRFEMMKFENPIQEKEGES